MDDLLTDFLTETNESLAEADLALVKLEQKPNDAATLALIFRLVHTIKGTCGFLALSRLEKVAHAAENVLGKVRDGALSVSPDLITAILSAIDRIKLIVAGLESNGAEPSGDDRQLISDLDAIFEGRKAASPPIAATPPSASPPAKASKSKTRKPEPAIARPDNAELAADVSPPGNAQSDANLAAQTIRVGVDVLENLMTLVSELVLTRNQLLQLARSQENGLFTGPLQRLSHITSDLQEGVMKTRMQPIGIAWNKLPRIVRDLSRELGKKIDLVMMGAETELVGNRLLQTGDGIGVGELQAGDRRSGDRLQLLGRDGAQPGIGQRIVGVRDERLRGALVAEQVQNELEHGVHQ